LLEGGFGRGRLSHRRGGNLACSCQEGRGGEEGRRKRVQQRSIDKLWEDVGRVGKKGVSAAFAAIVALNVSTGAPALGGSALAETRQDTSVVGTSTVRVADDVKGPASIVKDCRTDSPDLQTVYWISSRSVGQNPTLYAVDKDGKLIGTDYEVQTRNVGQEEIVFVHRLRKNKMEDFIVLADTSNKFKNRNELKVYEIAPGVPAGADDNHAIDVEREIAFEFPAPAPSAEAEKSSSYTIPVGPTPEVDIQYPQEDYDTAAIIVIDDTLWAFSKRSLGSSTALYRLPLDTISPYVRSDDKKTHTLEFVQEFSSGAPACGADVSTDGKRLALMTRETIFLFDLTTEAAAKNPIANLTGRFSVPKSEGAAVGITWDDAKTMIVLTDKNEMTKISLSA